MREHEHDDQASATHEQELVQKAPERAGAEHDSEAADTNVQRAAIAAASSGNVHSLGPGGLSTLQRLAGNAGVSNAIQQQRSTGQPSVVQRHGGHHQEGRNDAGAAKVQKVIQGSGTSIPEALRDEAEEMFGADFSNVKIHRDAAAHDAAASVRAKAFTVGDNIVLGRGISLDSPEGKHTFFHEAGHVLQQRHGPVAGAAIGGGVSMSTPNDHFEVEAEENAVRMMKGEHARLGSIGHDGAARSQQRRAAPGDNDSGAGNGTKGAARSTRARFARSPRTPRTTGGKALPD